MLQLATKNRSQVEILWMLFTLILNSIAVNTSFKLQNFVLHITSSLVINYLNLPYFIAMLKMGKNMVKAMEYVIPLRYNILPVKQIQ